MAAQPTITVGSLDAAHRVPARCKDLDVSLAFLASYLGWSKSELSKRLANGLTGPQTETIYAALDDLSWMINTLYPLRPRMQPEDGQRVRNFISALRNYRDTSVLSKLLQEFSGGFAALAAQIK